MKVALITNRPAYYRVPVFQRIAEVHQTDFFFTAQDVGRWWTHRHDEETVDLSGETASARALAGALRTRRYDCVVSGLCGRTHLLVVAAVSESARFPLVVWVDMWSYPRSLVHALGRPVVLRLIRRADAIVSSGSHVTNWIATDTGRERGVFCMPQAVDNDAFGHAPSPATVEDVRRTVLPPVGVVACFVGRLEPEKGLDVLLAALAESRADLGLVIVGAGSCDDHVRADVVRLGLQDRVRIVGWLRQAALPSLYRACDFLVIPSISSRVFTEPWALVANEAMNAGRAVIASDCVGAAAGGLVVDNETGLVVPERDATALAAAMNTLAADARLRGDLGHRASIHVKRFNFDTAAAAFLDAIEHATEKRSSRAPRRRQGVS